MILWVHQVTLLLVSLGKHLCGCTHLLDQLDLDGWTSLSMQPQGG